MNEYQIGFREVRASIRCDDVCLPMLLEDQNCYRCLMCHATEIMEFLWERNYQLNDEWDVMILLLTSQKLGLKVMQLCLVKTFRGNSLDFFLSRIHAFTITIYYHHLFITQFSILPHHNFLFILNEPEVGLAVVSGYLREHKWKSIFKNDLMRYFFHFLRTLNTCWRWEITVDESIIFETLYTRE